MASNKIKGITVEIGGDTTTLGKALADVEKDARSVTGEIREVERALKSAPDSAVLWQQKQELLNRALEDSREKLRVLEDAQADVERQFQNGEIDGGQYRAFQRELESTRAEVGRFTEELESMAEQADESASAVQSIANAGTKLQKVGGQIEEVGKKVMPLSLAVAGVGVAGVKVASDFEKAMSGVKAITGATGEEFEALREKAVDLGATTAFSASEVAEAMTEMAKAGWTTTQIIDGMAGVLDATAASGESLGSVATIVADAITGFGLSAQDSARVADLLTQAANSGTIGVTDLGESFKYIAPLALSMGLSIEEVTTAVSAMSMAGIKGSQAGTSLRTVLANMTKPSKAVADAMQELGFISTETIQKIDFSKVEKAERSVENATISLESAQIKLNDAISKHGENSSQAQLASNSYEKAQLKLAQAMETLASEQEGVSEEMKGANILMTEADGSFRSFDDILTTMRSTFAGLTDDQKAYYATALAGKEGMSGLLSLLNLTQAEYDELSASMDNCGGIAGETAAIMQDNLQSKVEQLGGALESLAIKLADYVIPFLTKLAEKITSAVDAFTNLNPKTQKTILIIGGIVAAAGPLLVVIGKLVSTIGTIMTIIPQLAGVISLVANPIGIVIGLVTALVAAFITLWNTSDGFRQFWIGWWEEIQLTLEGFFDSFVLGWETIIAFASETIQGFIDSYVLGWEIIKSTVEDFFDSFVIGWGAIIDFIRGVPDTITGFFAGVGTWFTEKFTEAYEGIKGAFNDIVTFVSGIWDSIKTVFTELGTAIGDTVGGAIKSVINGVLQFVEDKVNSAIDALNSAIDFINGIPGVDIGEISRVDLPRLAKGGVLHSGTAVVAEAGPELLEIMSNGKARVTPLSGATRNTALAGAGGGTVIINNKITVDKIANDYDVDRLSERLSQRQKSIEQGKGR